MTDLDRAATTSLDPRVRASMVELLADPEFEGNPSSVHARGRRARAVVETARRRVAAALGVEPLEVTFTSGGTESDALGLLGTARALRAAGRPHGILSNAIEHPAVLEAAEQLRLEGHAVVWGAVDRRGCVVAQDWARQLAEHPEVGVVSLGAANHELGNRHPVAAVTLALREQREDLLIHCDAVAAFGKQPLDFGTLGVDLLSISSHKINGPKGAGALIHRKSAELAPLWRGGHQERGRRVGTENPLAIHGFGVAAELVQAEIEARVDRLARLGARLRTIVEAVAGSSIEGDGEAGSALLATFDGCTGELVTMGLDLAGICVSTGAACNAGTLAPSRVLRALGHANPRAGVRFSIDPSSTDTDLDHLAAVLPEVVATIRRRGRVGGDR